MRSILGILLLLFAAGVVSCRIEGRAADGNMSAPQFDWVRTVDGWERPDNWTTSLAPPPAVHPLVVAAGQVFLSLFALAAATSAADQKRSG